MPLRVIRPDPPADEPPRRRRLWRAKFREAFRGIKLGVRGHSSFFVHFFSATLVVVAAAVLQCDLVEWCILLGCVGVVLTAELFNSAIETLVRSLESPDRDRAFAALDVAAGAVLMASFTAAIVGLTVLGRRAFDLFQPAIP